MDHRWCDLAVVVSSQHARTRSFSGSAAHRPRSGGRTLAAPAHYRLEPEPQFELNAARRLDLAAPPVVGAIELVGSGQEPLIAAEIRDVEQIEVDRELAVGRQPEVASESQVDVMQPGQLVLSVTARGVGEADRRRER